MITRLEDCSIRRFMKALFDRDFKGIGAKHWDRIFTEYSDVSETSKTAEKELFVAIHNIQTRLITVPQMIQFQCNYFKEYSEPYFEGLEWFKDKGHDVTWDLANPMDFVKQLQRIEIREKKWIVELNKAKKDLDALRKEGGYYKQNNNAKQEFVKMLNRIGKYRRNDIDEDKINMYRYALMVKDFFDNYKTEAK